LYSRGQSSDGERGNHIGVVYTAEPSINLVGQEEWRAEEAGRSSLFRSYVHDGRRASAMSYPRSYRHTSIFQPVMWSSVGMAVVALLGTVLLYLIIHLLKWFSILNIVRTRLDNKATMTALPWPAEGVRKEARTRLARCR